MTKKSNALYRFQWAEDSANSAELNEREEHFISRNLNKGLQNGHEQTDQ